MAVSGVDSLLFIDYLFDVFDNKERKVLPRPDPFDEYDEDKFRAVALITTGNTRTTGTPGQDVIGLGAGRGLSGCRAGAANGITVTVLGYCYWCCCCCIHGSPAVLVQCTPCWFMLLMLL